MTFLTQKNAAHRMILDARTFYEHGWLMGTSGNLSIKLNDGSFLITASGADKGQLTEDDFLVCDLLGQPLEDTHKKPSAETLIHCAIYDAFPEARAVYHTHEPFAALCSNRDQKRGHTTFTDVEMNKGLGIWHEGASAQLPILPNHADLNDLAQATRAHLAEAPIKMPCINILRHGPYVWGNSAFEAKRHMESLAYLHHYSWQWGMYQRT